MADKPSDRIDQAAKKLTQRVYKATDALAAEMDRRFTEAISDDIWDWPNAPTPRDIVDTGALRASQRYTKLKDGTYQFTWGVPYATRVHEGGTFSDGAEMPARPWTRYALNKMRQDKAIPKILKAELDGNR